MTTYVVKFKADGKVHRFEPMATTTSGGELIMLEEIEEK